MVMFRNKKPAGGTQKKSAIPRDHTYHIMRHILYYIFVYLAYIQLCVPLSLCFATIQCASFLVLGTCKHPQDHWMNRWRPAERGLIWSYAYRAICTYSPQHSQQAPGPELSSRRGTQSSVPTPPDKCRTLQRLFVLALRYIQRWNDRKR